MRRRELLVLLGGAMTTAVTLRAQQKAIPVIGYLSSQSAEALAPILPAFRGGLEEAGYVEGRNVSNRIRLGGGPVRQITGDGRGFCAPAGRRDRGVWRCGRCARG